jgi:hypothetical protein
MTGKNCGSKGMKSSKGSKKPAPKSKGKKSTKGY